MINGLNNLKTNKMKETLEEALNKLKEEHTVLNLYPSNILKNVAELGAKWQAERMGLMEIELNHTKTLLASCEKALEDRDKQAERMYSEEDILDAWELGAKEGLPLTKKKKEELFEQFKKK
jgi:hypothetical protein